MAIGIHIAKVALMPVNSLGTVIDKNAPQTTIKQMLTTSSEHRVVEDAAISTTTGNPTIDNYLKAEAAIDYVLYHMDQYNIITYDQGAINSAT